MESGFSQSVNNLLLDNQIFNISGTIRKRQLRIIETYKSWQ